MKQKNKSRKMGRRKVCPETLREIGSQRKETFGKRTRGLFKKAHELSAMCGCALYLAVAGEDGRLFQMHRLRNRHLDELAAPSCRPLPLEVPRDTAHRSLEAVGMIGAGKSSIKVEEPSCQPDNFHLLNAPTTLIGRDIFGAAGAKEEVQLAHSDLHLLPSSSLTPMDVADVNGSRDQDGLQVMPFDAHLFLASVSSAASASASVPLAPLSSSKIWFYNHTTEKMEYSGLNCEPGLTMDPNSCASHISPHFPCPCSDCLSGRSSIVGRVNSLAAATTSADEFDKGWVNIAQHVSYPSALEEDLGPLRNSQGFNYCGLCEETLNSLSGPNNNSSEESSPEANTSENYVQLEPLKYYASSNDHITDKQLHVKVEPLDDLALHEDFFLQAGNCHANLFDSTWFEQDFKHQ